MLQDWRVIPGKPTPEVDAYYDWGAAGGLVRAVEKCNGAGVCRKRAEAGGTMCPSYMATLNEKDSTRGRSNIFRQALYSPNPAEIGRASCRERVERQVWGVAREKERGWESGAWWGCAVG